jgi:hypothetical protein
MSTDLKNVSLGVGFLAAILVFSMAAAGATIIAVPALAKSDGSGGGGGSSSGSSGSAGGGASSAMITNAQTHLAEAMTALQSKNTTGAMMHLKLLNQTLSTLSMGAGGMVASGGSSGGSSGGGS